MSLNRIPEKMTSDLQVTHAHCHEEIEYYKRKLLESEMEVLRLRTYVGEFLLNWIDIQRKRCEAQEASIRHFMDDKTAAPKAY